MSSTSQPAAMRNKRSSHSHACGDALHTECLAHHCNRTKETRAPPLGGASLRLIGAPPRFRVAPGRPAPARVPSPPLQSLCFHGRIRRPPSVGTSGIGFALFLASESEKRGGSTTPPTSRDDGWRRMGVMDDPADACRQTGEGVSSLTRRQPAKGFAD